MYGSRSLHRHEATRAMSPLSCFWVSWLTTVWMRTSGLLTSTYDLSTPGIFIWNNFFWVFDMICAYDGTNDTQPPLISLWYSTTTFTKFVDQSFPGLSIDFWLHSFGVFPFASLLFHISLVPLAGQVRSDRVGSVGGQLSFSETRDGDGTMTGYFFSILFLFFF